MKKVRILIFTLIIALFMINPLSSIALNKNNEIHHLYVENFKNKIALNLPMFDDWKKSSIEFNNFLFTSGTNDICAVLYDVKINTDICGYIIVNYNNNDIIEFSLNASPYADYLNEYKNIKFANKKIIKEKYIYSPGYHAIEIQLSDDINEVEYDFTHDVEIPIQLSNNKNMNIIDDENNIYRGDPTHYKILSVPDVDYTDSCIPSAIGNVLGYWDVNGYPNLIISPWTVYDAINEINWRLIAAVGDNVSNAGIPIATQGYCKTFERYPNNFTVTNVWSPSYTAFTAEINASRPTLVGFAPGNIQYGNGHMTTGVGYYYEDGFPDEKYIYVHDAWSSTPVNYYVLWSSVYNDFIAKIVP